MISYLWISLFHPKTDLLRIHFLASFLSAEIPERQLIGAEPVCLRVKRQCWDHHSRAIVLASSFMRSQTERVSFVPIGRQREMMGRLVAGLFPAVLVDYGYLGGCIPSATVRMNNYLVCYLEGRVSCMESRSSKRVWSSSSAFWASSIFLRVLKSL